MSEIIEQKFSLGDLAQLKSGGPEMTVSHVQMGLNSSTDNYDLFTGFVICQWFVDGTRSEEKFHQDTLDKLD